MVTAWPRPRFAPGGGAAQVFLACFADTPPPKEPTLIGDKHGIPGGGLPPQIEIAQFNAEQAPDFFVSLLEGPIREQATRDLGRDTERLGLARYCVRINGTVPDPADLGYLQSAWGVARFFVESGACAVLDGHSMRWTAGDEILRWKPDRPFDLAQEITVVFEADEAEGYGHPTYTHGMVKFGRPDILIPGVPEEEMESSRLLLSSVAQAMALGQQIAPGDRLDLEGGRPLSFEAYDPGRNAPPVQIQPDSLVLRQG